MTTTHPFIVDVDDATLDDLRERLSRTRWPDQIEGRGWSDGTDLDYLKDLCDHWAHGYDWPAAQAKLNQSTHFTADISGTTLHFVHERGRGPQPMPLLMLHGWPSTFVQMLPIIPMLADPETSGSSAADSFDVVAVSLPGFGFSSRPTQTGMHVGAIAELVHRLMVDELGYTRYATRSSDLGSGVTGQLALAHPDALIGCHISGTNPFVASVPDDLTPAEKTFVDQAAAWMQTEMGYAIEQSSRPQTLAYGLNDSPAGLAAWLVEKFRAWSDCDGNLEKVYDRDDLLTNLTIYWATETIGSSMRLYYESARMPATWGRADVPTAAAQLPADMFPTPREWAERFTRIDRWTELPRGGHFGEWEVPDLIAADIQEFFADLR